MRKNSNEYINWNRNEGKNINIRWDCYHYIIWGTGITKIVFFSISECVMLFGSIDK